jgi:hypothetical protein
VLALICHIVVCSGALFYEVYCDKVLATGDSDSIHKKYERPFLAAMVMVATLLSQA